MDTKSGNDKILLSHHEQQPLCTTRLPYRQGRKLTAVKVYTINDESRHLLIFGVPSLNIRLETKSLFQKFGKITQFNISPYHEAEQFTETYHLIYERIQSARIAKKMLDTKNFYGGLLHICYAPEYETVQETKQKILQRKKDVLYRIQYLQNEEQNKLPKITEKYTKNGASIEDFTVASEPVSYNLELPRQMIQKTPHIYQSCLSQTEINYKRKLNMGEINTICIGKQIRDVVCKPKKRKTAQKIQHTVSNNQFSKMVELNQKLVEKTTKMESSSLEVVDATSIDSEIVTNINEQIQENLNQKEIIIKKIPQKPMNIIKFNLANKKS